MTDADKLTHFNALGEAHMVDVGNKAPSAREATASGRISMRADTLARIMDGGHRKGDVLGIARIAGIMGAKKTAELIPLCHPVMLTHIQLDLVPDPEQSCVRAVATAATHERTGVEMEALTAVQVALLTIYDMCKAIDRGMTISDICVERKSGGNSGDWQRSSPSN